MTLLIHILRSKTQQTDIIMTLIQMNNRPSISTPVQWVTARSELWLSRANSSNETVRKALDSAALKAAESTQTRICLILQSFSNVLRAFLKDIQTPPVTCQACIQIHLADIVLKYLCILKQLIIVSGMSYFYWFVRVLRARSCNLWYHAKLFVFIQSHHLA